ncbi:hypothetical protein KP509_30G006000 [Ceratopteris richardii]|uniref:Uncharacterized protein n=1 Tax=Ceratopteris richardii TaxID=49495 RepID=A0A8T2R0B4_CERRI|nr:hypothetical protein KP509_30G006000 [Ceratopteris richardii]
MNNRVCGICIHGYKSGLESFPKSFQIFCCDVPYNNGEYEEARSISFAAFCEQRVSSCKFVSALDPDYPIVAYRIYKANAHVSAQTQAAAMAT